MGAAGEICVKGPQVMRGYWNKPEANAAAFTADGYFRTGDIGMFDPQGLAENRRPQEGHDPRLRASTSIPNEVEEVVAPPGRRRMRVRRRARREERRGSEAVRRPSAGGDADQRKRGRALSQGMTAYKVPRIVRFIDALPKSAVGKILRRELRDVA